MEFISYVCDPMEVAAHNDIVAMREHFGKKMAFKGGVDKRKMAAGGRELEEELLRIKPVVTVVPFLNHHPASAEKLLLWL